MSNAADEIRARTQAFVASLVVLIRQAALEAASAALGGGTTVATPAPVAATRGRGRPRKAAAPVPAAKAPVVAKAAPAAKAPAAKKAAAAKRAPGAKRPPAELAKLIEGLDRYIRAHPGVRMDALSKALATPAKDLRFPVVKLVRAKRVRTEGQRQNMAYFPA